MEDWRLALGVAQSTVATRTSRPSRPATRSTALVRMATRKSQKKVLGTFCDLKRLLTRMAWTLATTVRPQTRSGLLPRLVEQRIMLGSSLASSWLATIGPLPYPMTPQRRTQPPHDLRDLLHRRCPQQRRKAFTTCNAPVKLTCNGNRPPSSAARAI